MSSIRMTCESAESSAVMPSVRPVALIAEMTSNSTFLKFTTLGTASPATMVVALP